MINYEAHLNPAQLEAVTTLDGPVLVVAGAGSGKTRTLIYRLARLVEEGIRPERVLLLTFTRKAAEEMLSRAQELSEASCKRVAGGTFHSLANQWLRRIAPRIGYPREFHILDRPDTEAILTSVLGELNFKPKRDRLPKKRTLAELFSRMVNRQASLEDVVTTDCPQFLISLEKIEKIEAGYREYKFNSGLMDFDDLLVLFARALEDDEAIREEVASRYEYLMVDEYQDTNPIQAKLVRLLALGHERVMAVGDDSQSIYSFRGADLQNMLDFPELFPGTTLIKLEENYRSTQPILDVANAVIAPAKKSFTKCLVTNQPGDLSPLIFEARDETDQSRFVVDRIQGLIRDGLAPDEIAVLFRAGYHSFDLEVALTRAGIGFVKYGGLKFAESAHVKDVLAFLKARANPKDNLSISRMAMLLPGVGPKKARQMIDWLTETGADLSQLNEFPGKTKASAQAIDELAALMQRLKAAEMRGPAVEVAEVIEFYEPYLMRLYDDYPKRQKGLEQVVAIAQTYRSTYRFLADLALDPPSNLYSGPKETGQLVLSTIHSAKGLEWKAVFIIWAAEGRFPAGQSLDDEDALEEERRMMYVAVTRAREQLFITSPIRSFSPAQGGTVFHSPSRFLEEARNLINPFKPSAEAPATRVIAEPEPEPEPIQDGPGDGLKVGTPVSHKAFGVGRVAGYLGDKRIVVYFESHGHKTLHLDYAPLTPI